jgi:hypothetical protein
MSDARLVTKQVKTSNNWLQSHLCSQLFRDAHDKRFSAQEHEFTVEKKSALTLDEIRGGKFPRLPGHNTMKTECYHSATRF